jgi:serine/threonine protein kinase
MPAAKGGFVVHAPKPAQYTAKIARGSEGDVYRAVVKIKNDRTAARREYRIQKNCTHPGVAHVDMSTCGMIFQPAADMDLLSMIHVHKRSIGTRLAWDFIDQIRTALHTIHGRGYIHRDIKLENILVYGSTVRISDFGFATRIKPGELLTQKLGSPTYVAPEIMAGVPYNTKADMWSFGVVSFALLTGYKPFAANCYRTIAAPGRDRIRDAASAGDQRALIDTTLCVDPTARASSRDVCKLRIRPAQPQTAPQTSIDPNPETAPQTGIAPRRSSRLLDLR